MKMCEARARAIASLLLSVVGCCSFAFGAEKLPDQMGRDYPPTLPKAEAVVYKTVGDVELKMYVHRPDGAKAGERRPAIVFFFGGGWKGGSPAQFRYQCEYLAARGMVAVTADYRVASRHDVKAVDCVRDAAAALSYLRANAERLGIDPDRIASAGGSAGGHLAACLGTLDDIDGGTPESKKASYRPNAMVLFNPALHFGDGPGLKLDAERTGIDPLKISPFHHVAAGDPPTLLLFGTADGMFGAAEAFAKKMKELGNRCELDAYADQPHGFFNLGRGEGNKNFRATLESVDAFLKSLGYLQGPSTVGTYFE